MKKNSLGLMVKTYCKYFDNPDYFAMCKMFGLKMVNLVLLLDFKKSKLERPSRWKNYYNLKLYGENDKIAYRCTNLGYWKRWTYDSNGKVIYAETSNGHFKNYKIKKGTWNYFLYGSEVKKYDKINILDFYGKR